MLVGWMLVGWMLVGYMEVDGVKSIHSSVIGL